MTEHPPYPSACPFCLTEFAYTSADDGNTYYRVVAIYDRDADRAAHWHCPSCSRTWKRD